MLEDVGLLEPFNLVALLVAFLAVLLQGKYIGEVNVILQEGNAGVLVQVSVGLHKAVVCLVQLVEQWLQAFVALILGLIGENICKCALDCLV